jgi:hypothetical protein
MKMFASRIVTVSDSAGRTVTVSKWGVAQSSRHQNHGVSGNKDAIQIQSIYSPERTVKLLKWTNRKLGSTLQTPRTCTGKYHKIINPTIICLIFLVLVIFCYTLVAVQYQLPRKLRKYSPITGTGLPTWCWLGFGFFHFITHGIRRVSGNDFLTLVTRYDIKKYHGNDENPPFY